jgi:serine/threonine-protein kinase BUR1
VIWGTNDILFNLQLPVTSLRELQMLERFHEHENIIDLIDVVAVCDNEDDDKATEVVLVFPYMEHDLYGLLRNFQVDLTPNVIKAIFHAILTGVAHLHKNDVLHRDLKSKVNLKL